MAFTLLSGVPLLVIGSGIFLAPRFSFSPASLTPTLVSPSESSSQNIGGPQSGPAIDPAQEVNPELKKVEAKASEIQAELLRIFNLNSEELPALKVRLLDSGKFSHPGESAIRAVYLDATVYLDRSLLQSSQLEHSLRHELVHWIVASLSNGRAPAWLDEGLAQLLAGPKSPLVKASLQKRGRAIRSVALSSLRQSFHHLDEDSLLLAYARSRMAAQSMVFRWTLPRIKEYLIDLGRGMSEDTCFEKHFGLSSEEFEASLDRR